MCKHYDEGDEAILAFVRETSPWIRIPDVFGETPPPQMYPKRKGRIVRQREGQAEMVLMRWGVWPFYEKKEKPELVTNARSEALLQKRLWRDSALHRRCLIPATGYFEAGLGPAAQRGEVSVRIQTARSSSWPASGTTTRTPAANAASPSSPPSPTTSCAPTTTACPCSSAKPPPKPGSATPHCRIPASANSARPSPRKP